MVGVGTPGATNAAVTTVSASIARNTFVENGFGDSYANSALVPAGTFTGRAVFTLTVS